MPTPIPTLDDIASDSSCLRGLPRDALASLFVRASTVKGALEAELLLSNANSVHKPAEPDVILDVRQASKILPFSPRWFWRHKHLPFARQVGRRLLISQRGLESYLAAQTHKPRKRGAA